MLALAALKCAAMLSAAVLASTSQAQVPKPAASATIDAAPMVIETWSNPAYPLTSDERRFLAEEFNHLFKPSAQATADSAQPLTTLTACLYSRGMYHIKSAFLEMLQDNKEFCDSFVREYEYDILAQLCIHKLFYAEMKARKEYEEWYKERCTQQPPAERTPTFSFSFVNRGPHVENFLENVYRAFNITRAMTYTYFLRFKPSWREVLAMILVKARWNAGAARVEFAVFFREFLSYYGEAVPNPERLFFVTELVKNVHALVRLDDRQFNAVTLQLVVLTSKRPTANGDE
ncbi:hypothetical protein PAPHI01_0653 [Pancytospora philotis]|nr:hypothetical protein PAPHI01_0653 [Pancytospora philotis]